MAAILEAAGVRALEKLLLDEVLAVEAAGRADPSRLAVPARVVVPSRSLAEHVAAALVRRASRPLLAVSVRTLRSTAQEILAACGEPGPSGESLFPLVVREHARQEPALHDAFEPLEDGYASVEANVRDLLDAGFEPVHGEALREALAELAGGRLAERAAALVSVAERVFHDLDAGRLGHGSRLLARARACLERHPGSLPLRALWIHGFADATGVQLDLLEALLRLPAAKLLIDRPPDPADPERSDPGALAFLRRTEERLAPGRPGAPAPSAGPPRIEVLHAPGAHAEVRAVGERVRARLDAGTEPERVAIVARDLGGYALPLRLHLRRLGVPFSGRGQPGPPRPAGRRLRGLLDLLRDGERLPAERWLELAELGSGDGFAVRADLVLHLHAVGAPRLLDVAGLDLPRGPVELPVREGVRAGEEGKDVRLGRRRLDREPVAEAICAARALVERLEAWPARAPLGTHLLALDELLDHTLGWRDEAPGRAELRELVAAADAAPDLCVGRDDFLLYADRELRHRVGEPLGGEGAGVQVLTVMEARERSFDALYVIGMSRDLFPRTITDDPLLPDALRARLRAVLPDLPVKREGTDEERFLFAQLLSASPEVTLSCAITDDDGRSCQPSPLVERLRLAGGAAEPLRLPALRGRSRAERARWHTAGEGALLAGLHGSRGRFERCLAAAQEEAWLDAAGLEGRASLAPPRVQVLREIDAAARPGGALGPYFGFVGESPGVASPYVTRVEAIAGCPWQAFLRRELRLEVPPDALVRLPPALDPLLVGSLVHDVLERIVTEALGERGGKLAEVIRREPVPVSWPGDQDLERWLLEEARELVRHNGVGLPGYEHVLVAPARERLRRAREVAWGPAGVAPVLGAEVEGSVAVRDAHGATREVRFRADRVDRTGGRLELLDYKTGAAKVRQSTPDKRHAQLETLVSSGALLQAVAYALGGHDEGGGEAHGAYLYLRPDTEEHAVALGADASDEDLARAFGDAVRDVLEACDRGVFFPRLVEADGDEEPFRCRWCDVREACWRGDSGARARLATWAAERSGRDDAALSAAERALLALWQRGGS
ncbi:MAG: PD-(D/E)XK nuclease family protein [Myxococcota bacterium]|nr:PD-(D/E)XK nuclease family protein [Myxococcota bacterium]